MRFITGGIMHETHTFSVEPTPERVWEIARGEECWSYAGTNHSLGGVIDGCRMEGIDLIPTFFAHATASGPTDRRTFERFIVELLGSIANNLPADGIVLTLHGAMVVEALPDGEGAILRRVRNLVGPDVPIAVTLDFHANTSQEMVNLADIIVGYDTYPHVDINERAQEAVRLLAQTVQGDIIPMMGFASPPMLPVPQALHTSSGPFKALFDHVHAIEESGEVISITLAGGFAYADTPAAGVSVIAITNNNRAKANDIAHEIATMAWSLRHDTVIHNTTPDKAVAQAIAWPEGPVVLVDVGDNIGGGTPGDGTVLLRELIDQGARDSVVVIADPESVALATDAGLGATVSMFIGGKVDRLHGDPVPVTGKVTWLGDGEWVHEGPENAGVPVHNGPVAIVDTAGVRILLESVKTAPGDLQQLKSAGIDPAAQHIIVVKAAVRWRGGYLPITRHHIDVDTPGLGSVNLNEFSFEHIRRPIHPLDDTITWPSPLSPEP